MEVLQEMDPIQSTTSFGLRICSQMVLLSFVRYNWRLDRNESNDNDFTLYRQVMFTTPQSCPSLFSPQLISLPSSMIES